MRTADSSTSARPAQARPASRTCACGRHTHGAARCASRAHPEAEEVDGPGVALDPAVAAAFADRLGTDLAMAR